VSALLATFGSTAVRGQYEAWRVAAASVHDADAALRWNMQESGDPNARPSDADLLPLQVAQRAQMTTRQALADAVAGELVIAPS
jgi:hypothetical protein